MSALYLGVKILGQQSATKSRAITDLRRLHPGFRECGIKEVRDINPLSDVSRNEGTMLHTSKSFSSVKIKIFGELPQSKPS